MDYKIISVKDSTDKQIKEQSQLRLNRINSEVYHYLAEQLVLRINGEPLVISEHAEFIGETVHQTTTRLSHLRTSHGFDIVNTEKNGLPGKYRIVGFTKPGREPRKRKAKPVYNRKEKPTTMNPLIEQVFC